MTDEEIKKIAREYAEYRAEPFDDAHDEIALEHFKDAVAFLRWFSKDYCTIQKSKVIGLWNEINNDAKTNIENGFPDYAQFNKLQLTPIELLFGKDMFKEEKEI